MKTINKVIRSFHKFSPKSGGKQKKWLLNWKGNEILEKNIQCVKVGKCTQLEIWKYVLKSASLFISFLAEAIQTREN